MASHPALRWLVLPALLTACDADVLVVQPPVADAGFDQVALVGDTVALDGTRSRAGDGTDDTLAFEWILVASPNSSSMALSDAFSPQPRFVADQPGTYVFELVVHQGGAASTPDFVNVMARTAVELDWIVPANGETGVPVATRVVAAFSSAVQASSIHAGTLGIADPETGPVEASVAFEPGSRVVVLTPKVPLAADTSYRFTVSQAVTDLQGSTLAAPSVSWFTTAKSGTDTVPPRVVATEPAAGDVVSGSAVVTAVFSEALAPATVNGSSVLLTDSANAVVASTVVLASGDLVATLVADAPLLAGETYRLTLLDTLADVIGNSLDGDGDGVTGGDHHVTFSIDAATHKEPPVVTGVVPGDRFTGVGLATSVVINFSEFVDPATITATSMTLAPESAPSTPVEADVTVDFTRLSATLDPDGWLEPGETFVVTLSDAVTDLAGNALDGDGDGVAGGSFSSRFTTGTPTGTTGILMVPSSIVPGESLVIALTDPDLDITAASDLAKVTVTTQHGETETASLLETGPASGIFAGSLVTSYRPVVPGSNEDGTLAIQAGDTVTVTFRDPLPGVGDDPEVTAVAHVQGGADGSVSVVNAASNQVEVTVVDDDPVANLAAGTGILGCGVSPCVRLSSSSTGDSEDLSLLVESVEGTFSVAVPTAVSSEATAGNGVLEISGATIIEVTYIDALRTNGDNRGFSVFASASIALDHLLIRDQPDGAGNVVTALTISTDDDLPLYAAGYDDQAGYLGDQSVSWTVAGGIGDVDPTQGAMTVFEPSAVGSGTVRATHPSSEVGFHDTGLITVVAGSLSYLLIRDASDGGGNVVGDLALNTDETRTLYAAGYDADHNFTGNAVVSWSAIGAIGTVSPAVGSSTLFDPTTVGEGAISASHASPGVAGDTTGAIRVSGGRLAQVVIYDRAGGPDAGGRPVDTLSLTTDNSVTLHAAGFDADGNYRGDQHVSWSVTGGIGIVGSSTGPSTSFDPTTVGSGQVVASHASVGSDSTGTITVNPGALDAIVLVDATRNPVGAVVLTTDDSLTVYAAGFDADGNFIADQTVGWALSDPIGTLSVATGVSTELDATTIGTGSIIADHEDAGVTDDSTGVITVNGGELVAVRIRDAASGGGAEVEDGEWTADDQPTLYAAGYDADDNYIGDQSVTWSVTHSLGIFAPNPAPSTIFYANTAGTGVITADPETAGIAGDSTGTITVGVGLLDYVVIRDAADGAGVEVGEITLAVNDQEDFWAAGYDADGNFISDVDVTWTLNPQGGTGTVSPSIGTSTTLSPTSEGDVTVTAAHATATDDSTGTIEIVASTAPQANLVTPASTLRNTAGLSLAIDGANFDCGPDPTVTFSPGGNIAVTSVDSCNANQLTVTVNVPCEAELLTYDVMITNADSESGISSSLFTVVGDAEGSFGDPSCSDNHDNDCDSLQDASDPDCAPPEEIQVSCTAPETQSEPSVCTVSLAGISGQEAHITCSAEPRITELFHDPFDDFSQWPTGVSGTAQIDCTSLPTGCAASAHNAAWEVERTIDTRGMDRVCLDFRIGQDGADAGESISVQFNTGVGDWQTAFSWSGDQWSLNDTRHDDAGTVAADWFGPVCPTDVDPDAGNNSSLGLRLSAASNLLDDRVFIDEMVATGVPGTEVKVFCDPFDNLAAWTTNAAGGELGTATFDGDSALCQSNAVSATAERCFSTAGLDVVDMELDFGQAQTHDTKRIRLSLSTDGSGGTFSEMLDLWLSNDSDAPGSFVAANELFDYVRLLRLTDHNPAAADNTDVCIRFTLDDETGNCTYIDNICVNGVSFPSSLFSFDSVGAVGGGDYEVSVTATRAVTADVECTWSRDAVTLTTDGVAPNSGPARVVFQP
jgi:hypothetical protein